MESSPEVEEAPEETTAVVVEEEPSKKDPAVMDDPHHDEVPVRRFSIGPISFNPIVSILGTVSLWGLAIFCALDPSGSVTVMRDAKRWVAITFTWVFVAFPMAWGVLLIVIGYYHGDVKLGKPDEEPEFDNLSYFAMIFSAGVGVGLFYFGVDEPLWHQNDNRFVTTGFVSQDEIDKEAINLTIFHWSIGGWIPYVLVGLSLGIAGFRDGLPFTMRSCLYRFLGERTWGIFGDLIDGYTIFTVVAGICTSLGLGAFQLYDGLTRIGANLPSDDDNEDGATLIRMSLIGIITLIATFSVVSGLHLGIKILSMAAFIGGNFLWFSVFFLDETTYLINLLTQAFGFYFQVFFRTNFQTDAFGQLDTGVGRSVDGLSPYVGWLDDWTVFYFAWWSAWSAFVGLFIARISKGRTICQVMTYALGAALSYTFIWFTLFGGAGIRMDRRALEIEHFVGQGNATIGNIEDATLADVQVPRDDGYVCYNVPETIEIDGEIVYEGRTGISPVCKFTGSTMWFELMYQYYGLGTFLSVVTLFSLSIYFITSSDSGSLVVDLLASNGDLEHHWIQKIYWAFTEGALAAALLYSGGSDALAALQAASLVAGLPMNFLLCFIAANLWKALEDGKELPKGFSQPVLGGILDYIDYFLSCFDPRGDTKFLTPGVPVSFVMSLLVPPLMVFRTELKMKGNFEDYSYPTGLFAVLSGVFLYFAIFLWFISIWADGLFAFAIIVYMGFAGSLGFLRYEMRKRFGLAGNIAEDFFASLFIYPQVVSQMHHEVHAQ